MRTLILSSIQSQKSTLFCGVTEKILRNKFKTFALAVSAKLPAIYGRRIIVRSVQNLRQIDYTETTAAQSSLANCALYGS